MAAETFKGSQDAATISLHENLGEGIELFVDVVSTSQMEIGTPRPGGPPATQERTVVVLTVIDTEAGVVLLAGEGEADITEVFRIHGPEPTARITGAIPVLDTLTFQTRDFTLDLFLEASGRLVGERVHESFVEPGEGVISSNVRTLHAPATVTGTFTVPASIGNPESYGGGTYDILALDPDMLIAEISTHSANTAVVQPASSDWAL